MLVFFFQGKQSDAILVQGISIGKALVTAKLVEPTYTVRPVAYKKDIYTFL